MTYNWKQWESQIVDGEFPLHQYLGSSDHDAVFLTERPGQAPTRAAIKLIPLEFVDADRQLASWERVAQLSHGNLLRIFEHGRAQIEGADVLYVVMEYADEDLSQILPSRPLTAAECTDMLQPVIDALAYIHRQGLVNGHVSPSNVMASGNHVKISSERIQSPGPLVVNRGPESAVYEAPEVPTTGLSVATDVWSLGATALEAVTQNPPTGDGSLDPAIPQLPEPLFSIIRNCLRVDPQQRWTLAQISNSLRPAPAASKPAATPAVQPAVVPKPLASRGTAAVPTAASRAKSNRIVFPLIAIGVVLAALIGYFLTRNPHTATDAPPAQPAMSTDAPAPTSAPAGASASAPPVAPSTSSGKGRVIHRETPVIPAGARNTIHGTVRVNVRVLVDPAGNVTATAIENHGPSRYFAGLARKSASDWKFAPPHVDGKSAPSEWVLKYEFRRGGTTVVPTQETP